ncbi:CHRNA9 [Branchiostoma lanceolatum]|uniref:CHRNA9 protein n=1 Tax=Branchiostoma lanceolatum TaxID=7740 RepID=A0A8K0AIA0_BRALA|nr:CHRNA9 [Branchiostoma lanceolatum]
MLTLQLLGVVTFFLVFDGVFSQTVCGRLTGASGSFVSPNYPNKYPNGYDCRWEITVTPPKVVRLTFTEFHVEHDYDFVYVYDGITTDVSSRIATLTEEILPDPVTSSGSTMTVRFTSDASKNRNGFQANFTAVDVEEFGTYRCADNRTFIQARKRCDGNIDCKDGSDEGAETCSCQDIPSSLAICQHLEYQQMTLPNPLNFTHTTVDQVINSARFDDLSTLAHSECHPRVRDIVCAVIIPRCESSPNLTQLLPCRSWCEEVTYSCSKESSWSAFPSCTIFPNKNCNNIMASTTKDGECFDGNGANYRGDQARGPLTGMGCQRWDDDHYYKEVYPWANLEDNKCRNPDGHSRPWCFTPIGLQFCDVIPCNQKGCKDPGNPRFGKRSPMLKFYWPGDRITYSCDVGFKFGENSPPSKARCVIDDETGEPDWETPVPQCKRDYIWHLQHDLILSSHIYNKEVSPTENLEVRAYVVDIINLDEKEEQIVTSFKAEYVWIDERLSWDPSDYGDLHHFHIRDDLVWKPTLTLQGNADARYSGVFPSSEVDVDETGEVTWTVESLARTMCDLDPFLFPQDNMTCEVCWKAKREYRIVCANSTSHEDENLLTCQNDKEDVEDGEWSGKATLSAINNTACLTMTLKRDPTYHLSTTISPCLILIVLMIITFIIPIDKGDRIGFGVTVLLAMVVSLVVITGFLPVSNTLPFIAMLIIVCMALMALFMLTTVFIIIIHDKKGPVPKWARTIFLKHLARALLMGDLTEKLKNEPQTDYTYSGVGKVVGGHTNNSFMFDRDVRFAGVKLPRKMKNEVGAIIGIKLDELNSIVRLRLDRIKRSIDVLAMATSGKDEEEVAEYALLAEVLDRVCLVLYIIAIAVAVPCTQFMSRN